MCRKCMKTVYLRREIGKEDHLQLVKIKRSEWDGTTPLYLESLIHGTVEPAKGDEYARDFNAEYMVVHSHE